MRPEASLREAAFLTELITTRSFRLGHPVSPRFTPDGNTVLFLRSPPRVPALHLYELDVATGKTRVLLTPAEVLQGAREQLSPEEAARRERTRQSGQGFTGYTLSPDGASVLVTVSGRLYLVERATRAVRELPTSKGVLLDPRFSPDGRHLAYVLENDLYALQLASGAEKRLTFGGSRDVSHGLAEFVAQEEMDRMEGYWWSPDSASIAYEEADTRDVELWHLGDPAEPGTRPQLQRYPRPGKDNAKVRLGVVSLADAGGAEAPRTRWVAWDAVRFPYLGRVVWKRGGPLSLVVVARAQQEALLLAADDLSGQTRTLLTERDPAWLNLDPHMPRWLEDGTGFLWTSEREGAWQLELRQPDGALQRVLVPPGAGYVGVVFARTRRDPLYFRASADPLEIHLWRTSAAGAPPERLTHTAGQYTATFSKDGRRYVLQRSTLQAPPTQAVHESALATGPQAPRPVMLLPSVAQTPPFVPTTEVVSVRAEAFRCAVTFPRGHARGRRLPVLLEVYGGPHAQLVKLELSRWLRSQWLADQGFGVVTCDGRGTPRRGRAWERALRGSFAAVPLDDQVAALRAVGERFPDLDLSRVGVTGWSFGGYLSALAVLREPSVFKAAVAGAPVTDWSDYDTFYTERYLGLPAENPGGYAESNLLTHAAKLARPLLLIHGTSDDNVYFRHTLKLSGALFRAGRHHELLALPGFTHMVPDPLVRVRLEERVVRFFQEHL